MENVPMSCEYEHPKKALRNCSQHTSFFAASVGQQILSMNLLHAIGA